MGRSLQGKWVLGKLLQAEKKKRVWPRAWACEQSHSVLGTVNHQVWLPKGSVGLGMASNHTRSSERSLHQGCQGVSEKFRMGSDFPFS